MRKGKNFLENKIELHSFSSYSMNLHSSNTPLTQMLVNIKEIKRFTRVEESQQDRGLLRVGDGGLYEEREDGIEAAVLGELT